MRLAVVEGVNLLFATFQIKAKPALMFDFGHHA